MSLKKKKRIVTKVKSKHITQTNYNRRKQIKELVTDENAVNLKQQTQRQKLKIMDWQSIIFTLAALRARAVIERKRQIEEGDWGETRLRRFASSSVNFKRKKKRLCSLAALVRARRELKQTRTSVHLLPAFNSKLLQLNE